MAESFISTENRTWLVEEYGNDVYHYKYGNYSIVACTSIGYGYLYKIRKMGLFFWALKSPAPIGAKAQLFAILFLGFGIASQTAPKFQIPLHYDSDKLSIREDTHVIKDSVSSEKGSG